MENDLILRALVVGSVKRTIYIYLYILIYIVGFCSSFGFIFVLEIIHIYLHYTMCNAMLYICVDVH